MRHSTITPARTKTGLRRSLALGLASALALGAIAVGSVSAEAATPSTTTVTNATFSWGFNNYVAAVTGSSHAAFTFAGATAPATADSSVSPLGFTVAGGSGTLDADGDGTISFGGAVKYLGPDDPSVYSYQFSNLQLSIAGERGSLSAAVDGTDARFFNLASNGTRVVIANFGIASESVSPDSFALTTTAPDYVTTTYPNGSWPDTLRALIPASAKGFWSSSSQTVSQQSKKPLPISVSATAATPAVTASVTSVTPETGLTVSASGTGFRGVTNAGDAGIYVGIAVAGGLPDVSTTAGMASFVAANYVPDAALSTGAFVSTLTAAGSKFDRTKSYAVYTWQAHSHSNTSQDTETAITIDFAKFDKPVVADPVVPAHVATTAAPAPVATKSSIALSTRASSTAQFGKTRTIKAIASQAVDGTVSFTEAGSVVGTAVLVNGTATLKSKALAVGKHILVANFAGTATVNSATSPAFALTVTKIAPTVKVKATSFASGKRPVVTVSIPRLSNGSYAVGNVRAYVNGRSVKVIKLSGSAKGALQLVLPKSYDKSIKVSVKYGGSATVSSAPSKTVKFTAVR